MSFRKSITAAVRSGNAATLTAAIEAARAGGVSDAAIAKAQRPADTTARAPQAAIGTPAKAAAPTVTLSPDAAARVAFLRAEIRQLTGKAVTPKVRPVADISHATPITLRVSVERDGEATREVTLTGTRGIIGTGKSPRTGAPSVYALVSGSGLNFRLSDDAEGQIARLDSGLTVKAFSGVAYRLTLV